MIYEKIFRPILFKTDPEWIHHAVVRGLSLTSRIGPLKNQIQKRLFVNGRALNVKIGNLNLQNPIGLAAGFDKYIEAPLAYPMLGFGFAELGSITSKELTGNPKPRLWRIPDDQGLIVYYGLANCGMEKAKLALEAISQRPIPFGISIAPATGLALEEMILDYLETFEHLHHCADYITFNVSCPNVAGCDIFSQIDFIKSLMHSVNEAKQKGGIVKDVFIKIGPHLNPDQLDEVVDGAVSNNFTGIVATNLIKDRSNIVPKSAPDKMNHPGGISGSLLKEKSNEVIRRIYRRSQGELKIIGVGGIFNGQDAYDKIKAGASAVQIITGWIYGGPLTIKKINKELNDLIKKDGYNNISEAVGLDS